MSDLEPGLAALVERFVAQGSPRFKDFRADVEKITLARGYVDVMLRRLRRDLSKAQPRGPRKQYDEAARRTIAAMDAAVAEFARPSLRA